jgi:hypothetical protein
MRLFLRLALLLTSKMPMLLISDDVDGVFFIGQRSDVSVSEVLGQYER